MTDLICNFNKIICLLLYIYCCSTLSEKLREGEVIKIRKKETNLNNKMINKIIN